MGKEKQLIKKFSQDNFVSHNLDAQPFALKHLSLRDMVVTPDRVPKFTIPPLCQSRRRGLLQNPSDQEDPEFGTSRRHTIPWLALSPLGVRQVQSDAGVVVSQFSNDISADPGTRAAMSLPHLTKITTPYGFLALGESPCVPRRESLFFECHAQNMCSTECKGLGLQHPGRPALRRQSHSLSDIGNIPHEQKTPARSLSCGAANSLRCASGQVENLLISYPLADSCLPSIGTPGCTKGRLKHIIKKRLAAVRALTTLQKRRSLVHFGDSKGHSMNKTAN